MSSPRKSALKKTQVRQSSNKVMGIVFLDVRDIIHIDLLWKERKPNGEYNVISLDSLNGKLKKGTTPIDQEERALSQIQCKVAYVLGGTNCSHLRHFRRI